MKMNLRLPLRFGLCSAVILVSSLAAVGQNTGWYVRVDSGLTLTPDTELKEFFGPVTPNSKVEFDPGVRFIYGGGFRATDWFAAELQTGVMVNRISSITGSDDIDNASLANIPLLINARFDFPTTTPLSPYIGGGLGMSVAVIDSDRLEVGGTAVSGSESDVVFAYQAFGGLRYALSPNMGIGAEYHYFGTTQPSWDAHGASGSLRFGSIETHTITFAFDYRF
jgi:opacity protein-like surface antigen